MSATPISSGSRWTVSPARILPVNRCRMHGQWLGITTALDLLEACSASDHGAGDENRSCTVSLGISLMRPIDPDSRAFEWPRVAASGRPMPPVSATTGTKRARGLRAGRSH